MSTDSLRTDIMEFFTFRQTLNTADKDLALITRMFRSERSIKSKSLSLYLLVHGDVLGGALVLVHSLAVIVVLKQRDGYRDTSNTDIPPQSDTPGHTPSHTVRLDSKYRPR